MGALELQESPEDHSRMFIDFLKNRPFVSSSKNLKAWVDVSLSKNPSGSECYKRRQNLVKEELGFTKCSFSMKPCNFAHGFATSLPHKKQRFMEIKGHWTEDVYCTIALKRYRKWRVRKIQLSNTYGMDGMTNGSLNNRLTRPLELWLFHDKSSC